MSNQRPIDDGVVAASQAALAAVSDFQLGQIVVTVAVHRDMERSNLFYEFVKISTLRHSQSDWGDIHPDDTGLNEQALSEGSRLFSVYRLPEILAAELNATEANIWIITEADRSATTILWPSDY